MIKDFLVALSEGLPKNLEHRFFFVKDPTHGGVYLHCTAENTYELWVHDSTTNTDFKVSIVVPEDCSNN